MRRQRPPEGPLTRHRQAAYPAPDTTLDHVHALTPRQHHPIIAPMSHAPGVSAPVTTDFTVNGVPVRLDVDPQVSLMTVLRDHLRLTGTKCGCDDGRCGSCTVVVDGRATRSCRMTAGEAAGSAVVTIEGLARPGHLDPIQRAFVEAGAVHCGFCTPGLCSTRLTARPR